jgi:hypothetical protein
VDASRRGLERGRASWELHALEDRPRHRRVLDHRNEAHGRLTAIADEINARIILGTIDIREIDLRRVQGLYDHFIDIGRPKGPKSIEFALGVLRQILSDAVGQGVIDSKAVEAWKKGRLRRRSSSGAQVPPTKLLSAEEVQKLLEAAEEV